MSGNIFIKVIIGSLILFVIVHVASITAFGILSSNDTSDGVTKTRSIRLGSPGQLRYHYGGGLSGGK